jgi:hypothetical protein
LDEERSVTDVTAGRRIAAAAATNTRLALTESINIVSSNALADSIDIGEVGCAGNSIEC